MITVCDNLQTNTNNSNTFIRLTNRGAYIAFFDLWYFVDKKYHAFESPFISVLESFTVNIPSNADGIEVLVNYVAGIQLYGSIAQVSFAKADKICLTCYGTVFRGWVERTPCQSLGSSNKISHCPSGMSPICIPACKPISCCKSKKNCNPVFCHC